MESQVINPIKRKEKVFVMMDHFCKLAVLPETNIYVTVFRLVIHLESIAWNCSKEGWKPLPITQAGTCGKITYL